VPVDCQPHNIDPQHASSNLQISSPPVAVLALFITFITSNAIQQLRECPIRVGDKEMEGSNLFEQIIQDSGLCIGLLIRF